MVEPLRINGFRPPFDVDPRVAINNPSSLPEIVRSGIYSVVMRELGRKQPKQRKKPKPGKGTLLEHYVKAFNVVVNALTISKPPRLQRGTTDLTGYGKRENAKVLARRGERPTTDEKMQQIEKWAARIRQDNADEIA